MKIISSSLAFSSSQHRDQKDLSISEVSVKYNKAEPAEVRIGSDGMPRMWVDRVSFSGKEEAEYQSNCRAAVSSRSQVKSAEDESVVHEQQAVIEKLVGGLIRTDVVVGKMERGEDVVLNNGDAIRPKNRGEEDGLSPSAGQQWEMSVRQADIHFEQEQLNVSSAGQVVTEDGRTIDFSLNISFERAFVSRQEKDLLIRQWQEQVDFTDPLVISLDGKAPQLSDAWFEFDLDADGSMDRINFVNSGSGFLAFDKNSDGVINDGSELFGPGTGNGFVDLAEYDDDGNLWIDENDAVFSNLSVWTLDENGEKTLVSLKDAGVGAISLSYADGSFDMTQTDNTLQGQLKSSGLFLFEDGRVGGVHQVDLVSHQEEKLETRNAGSVWPGFRQQTVNPLPGAGIQSFEMPVQQEEAVSPLEELREKIDKLKEEMNRLFEKVEWETSKDQRSRKRAGHYHDPYGFSSLFPFDFQSRDALSGGGYF